jgi:SAM-dependent methyltransferase
MRRIAWALLGDVRGRVLDDGCACGWMLAELPQTAWGVGIDRYIDRDRPCGTRAESSGPLSPAAAALPGQSLPSLPVRLAQADAAHLPFPAGSFDLVLALDLLEQRPVEPGEALAEARRVLVPGGRLLVRVPAHAALLGPHDYYWGGGRRYQRQELACLVRTAGFTIRRLTYANGVLFPLEAAGRLLGRAGLVGGADLLPLPGVLNRALLAVLTAEANRLRTRDLPLGLSLLCLAQAP